MVIDGAIGRVDDIVDRELPPVERGNRGAFIVLVGPDGVGKTSVARAIIAAHGGPTAYFHFLPALGSPLPARPPDSESLPPGKGTPHGSRVLGIVRIARTFARAWLAHLGRVRPAVRRGTLVVADRWTYGYIAQPHSVRFYGPTWLVELIIRLLPRPDLVVALTAEPTVIRSRKQELTVDQIAHELELWASVPEPRLRIFAATDSPDAIARRILSELPT